MTRLEKLIIKEALIEYIKSHTKIENKLRNIGKLNAASEELRKCNIAKSISSYWDKVIDSPCGEVKI